MQTILGASGQIGQELARVLKRNFTHDIRLVSRNPRKVTTPISCTGRTCSIRPRPCARSKAPTSST